VSVEGHIEELHQQFLSALVVKEKYRDNVKKLSHCSALEMSIIALLHKTYNCIAKYRDAMQIVQQKEEFLDEAIIKYLNLVDCWFQV